MTPNDPHLFQLFWGLRHTVGLDLRLDDYELLVEAWAEGFQPSDYLELQALCRRLWTRSPEEQARFNQYFELYFCQYIDLEQAADSPPKAVTSVPPSETLDPSSAPLPEQVPPSSSVPPPSPASSSSRSTVPERSWNETQVGRAVPVQSLDSERFSLGPFTLNDEYFRPLTRRQLQQGWRRLRSVIKQGESDQLDIPATVKQIGQQGMLLEPCYRPKEVNCTEVLLLVDRSNSMAPFDLISERLISTAQQSLFRKDFRVLYHCSFRNYPVDTLYADPDLRRPIALASVLRPLNPLYTTALIFSDAGASRGGFNPTRFEKTQQFIGMLRDRVRQLAWLNPLSPSHWQSGTAKLIAEEVPMVELDLVGWHGLLKDIRGQRVPVLPSPAQLRYLTSAQPSRVQVEAQPSLDSIKQQLSKLVRESSDPARFEEAKQQILGFVRELPDSLDLLCHAAFPLALTPDLFYYLRENFQQDTPWQWVSEVLLSSVCHSVGYHLYELDYAVRHLLLKLLVRNPMFGRPRLYALSDSVLFYVEHRLDQTLYEANDFGEKPEWIALAYTEPNRLARQLAQRLEQTYVEGEVAQIKLASLAMTLAEPLKEAQFEPLLSLIRGQSRLARGDKRGAQAVLDAISTDSIEVDDIRLRVPGRPDVSFPDAQVLEFDTAKYGESTTASFPSLQARSLQVLTIEEDSSTPPLQTLDFEYVTLEQRQKRWEPVRHSAQCRQYIEALTEQIGLEMVFIPAGTFMMGEGNEAHEVSVPAFYMGKYTVTQAQWKTVAALEKINRDLEPNPSNFKGDDLPVEMVSWHDAIEFCQRLSTHSQRHYRLPSEAEWEYACRAETTTAFHFGDMITTDVANYHGSSYKNGPKGEYREKTIAVGSLNAPNKFGLHDMHGNIWEWCEDDHHSSFQDAPTDGKAWIDEPRGDRRISRGGSWGNVPRYCRSAYRDFPNPGSRNNYIGFRVVVSAPGLSSP